MRKLAPLLLMLSLAACNKGSNQAVSPTTQPPTSVPPTSPPPPTGPPPGCKDLTTAGAQFEITMSDYAFDPACVVVTADQGPVLRNEGVSPRHNFTVTGTGIDVDVEAGDTGRFEAIGLEPGTYDFFCKYHQTLGMTGTLVVED